MPVDMIIGKFIFAICSIKGIFVKSDDAILNAETPIFFKKLALSKSNGVDKKVIPVSSA